MSYLVLHRDGQEILRVLLDRDAITIGRGEESHIVLPDPQVSRAHCELERTDDGWSLHDTSKGGVLVDGERADDGVVLQDGAKLTIGPFVAVLENSASLSDEDTVVVSSDPTRILSVTDSGNVVVEEASLRVAEGPDKDKSFTLRGNAVVGKGSACDVLLTDDYVSSTHFRLESRPTGWFLVDLGSTNGTKLNGSRVKEAEVSAGSRIELGQTTLTFESQSKERPLEPLSTEEFQGMIGASAAMREVFALLQAVAATDAPVLLIGESGTGKELAARAVHLSSPRARKPFIPINSGGLSPNLVESEFFGHERGAFTGADRRRAGAFERAHGGTLFLDEIGELPLDLQAKLLRVLETGDFQRVGGNETLHSNARVVAATHRDLQAMVRENTFREDLFYRLAVVPVRIPPLRERAEDVELLAGHLLTQMVPGKAPELAASAVTTLRSHSWPGNVRELRNVLQRAVLFARGGAIEASHLALNPMESGGGPASAAAGGTIEDAEKAAIVAALRRHDGNRKAAASDLGIARSTLHEKMKKYDIDIPSRSAKSTKKT